MGFLGDYALQGQYGSQQQAMQQAMLQQVVPQAWANSTAYTIQYDYGVNDYGLAGATLKASPLTRDPAPSTSVKQSNEAWLDERVNEMRVKL